MATKDKTDSNYTNVISKPKKVKVVNTVTSKNKVRSKQHIVKDVPFVYNKEGELATFHEEEVKKELETVNIPKYKDLEPITDEITPQNSDIKRKVENTTIKHQMKERHSVKDEPIIPFNPLTTPIDILNAPQKALVYLATTPRLLTGGKPRYAKPSDVMREDWDLSSLTPTQRMGLYNAADLVIDPITPIPITKLKFLPAAVRGGLKLLQGVDNVQDVKQNNEKGYNDNPANKRLKGVKLKKQK